MKTKIFNLIICSVALMSSMSISAQKYICLKNDLDATPVSNGDSLKMYKYSTIDVEDSLKVRIDSMTDAAKTKEESNGLSIGAIFNVAKDDDSPQKVHFKDRNNKDRYNVSGVSLSVYYMTKIDANDYLIPKDNCLEVTLSSEENDYKQLFKFDSGNSSLIYEASDVELPENAKLIVDGNESFTDISNASHIKVKDGSTLRLILSSDNSYIADEVFTTDDLEKIDPTEDSNGLNWKKILFCVLLGLLGVVILGGIYYFFFSGTEEDDDEADKVKDGKRQRSTLKTTYDEGNGLNNQFDQIQRSLTKIESSVTSISSKLTDDRETDRLKNEIIKLESNLSQRENELKSKIETIKNRESEILQQKNLVNTLTQQNASLENQLEEAGRLEKGTLMVPDAKTFVQNAGRILSVCCEGEEVIKSFISSLSGKELTRISYFLASYIKEMPSKGRDQWNGIVSTLGIKGFVNDPDITKYLQGESNQMEWLRKHFIEDLLQSYISPLIIMLEQIRCANKFGISTPIPSNIEKIIREILDANKALGVMVKYIPLYAPISNEDMETRIDEISSELPEELESIVSVEENVPLYLSRIGVVAEGLRNDKTKCVVK